MLVEEAYGEDDLGGIEAGTALAEVSQLAQVVEQLAAADVVHHHVKVRGRLYILCVYVRHESVCLSGMRREGGRERGRDIEER